MEPQRRENHPLLAELKEIVGDRLSTSMADSACSAFKQISSRDEGNNGPGRGKTTLNRQVGSRFLRRC